jgi:hypothetical protein
VAAKIREANPLFMECGDSLPLSEAGTSSRTPNLSPDLGFCHYRLQPPAAQLIEKIDSFDLDPPLQPDMFAGMANKIGIDAILAMWMAADGYELTHPVREIALAGYIAHYLDNSLLYIIAEGWGTAQTKALCNLVGIRKLNLNTVIVLGYSLGLEDLRELVINVKIPSPARYW